MPGFQFASVPDIAVVTKSNWLTEALLKHDSCTIFRKLTILRQQGLSSDTAEAYVRQVHGASQEQTEMNQAWLLCAYESIKRMDQDIGFVDVRRYLDIGCCPGGYSKYILQTCPLATGMGLSLSVEDGGCPLLIPQTLLQRLDICMTDITSLDLAPSLTSLAPPLTANSKSTLISPIPFDLNSFDFVICDAHHLHDQQIEPHLRDPTKLLISQVLLALRAVYHGGKILLRLSCVEKPLTAQILLAFCRIAGHTETIKSLTLNKRLETFYLLAQGIRINTSEYRKLVDALEKLWYWMTLGGEGGVGRNITWEEQEMITSWEEVMSEAGINQIVRLGIKVWEIQCRALYGFLKSEGILRSKGIEIDIY